MTISQYNTAVSEVANYSDREAYVSALCLSDIWTGTEPRTERVEALEAIWEACNRSIKDISNNAGLSNRRLAERFGIPYRTVENWSGGQNSCALYVRLMMQEALGLLGIKIEK